MLRQGPQGKVVSNLPGLDSYRIPQKGKVSLNERTGVSWENAGHKKMKNYLLLLFSWD